MAWRQKTPTVSGNLIVDGTVESKHIKATTITADKFSGAVEEEHWAYNTDQDVSFAYSGYTTVHTWTFPRTELDIYKGRHVNWSAEGYMNTGTSTQYSGTIFIRLEAEVPTTQSPTSIGTATHISNPTTGYQIISFEGNASNKIGSGGSIGTQGGNYRTYKNLYYDPKGVQGSDLITNGAFTSDLSNWTTGAGSATVFFSTARITAPSSGQAFIYQAISTVVGETYQVTGNIIDGTANGIVNASSTPTLTNADTLGTSSAHTGSQAIDFEFRATGTTTYIVCATSAASSGQYVNFDNMVVKQYLRKTYVLLSTTGGQIVPANTPTALWYHPFSGASAGNYQVVDTYTQSTKTNPYTNRFRFGTSAYIGWMNDDIKLRLTCLNQIAFGKTVTFNDLKIFMQSRIVI